MSEFTAIPLSIDFDCSPIFKQETGNVESSISNILDLIVFTPKGMFHADPEFGFEYWNHEFSNINVREFNNNYLGIMSDSQSLNEISRKQCEAGLRESIMNYEPRLLKPSVKIELELNDKFSKRKSQSKYTMKICITGEIDEGFGIARQYEKRISFMVEPIARKENI